MLLPIVDAHLHIITPESVRRPTPYRPPTFTAEEYRLRTAPLRVAGGVVVAGSFQRDAAHWIGDALAALGPRFVGVVELDAAASDGRIACLRDLGVRGLRFNLRRHRTDLDGLSRLAERAAAIAGWHVEVYADGDQLSELEPWLRRFDGPVIDHLGMSERGLATALHLVDGGAFVKASGFGRVHLDIERALSQIYQTKSTSAALWKRPAIDTCPASIPVGRRSAHCCHPR